MTGVLKRIGSLVPGLESSIIYRALACARGVMVIRWTEPGPATAWPSPHQTVLVTGSDRDRFVKATVRT